MEYFAGSRPIPTELELFAAQYGARRGWLAGLAGSRTAAVADIGPEDHIAIAIIRDLFAAIISNAQEIRFGAVIIVVFGRDRIDQPRITQSSRDGTTVVVTRE